MRRTCRRVAPLPDPPIVWRVDTGFRHDERTTAGDVLRYEQETLGNALGLSRGAIEALDEFSAQHLMWACFSKRDALRYGDKNDVIRFVLDVPCKAIATDNEGGYLLFFQELPSQLSPRGHAMSNDKDRELSRMSDAARAAHAREAWRAGRGEAGEFASTENIRLAELGLAWDCFHSSKPQEPPPVTLDAIRAEPFNAVALALPDDASPELLRAVANAADFCLTGDHELMIAARAGIYDPPGYVGQCDVHEINEGNWLIALARFDDATEKLQHLTARENSARDLDDEEAKKRRAGRGGAESGLPSHAQLGANIRPEVGASPAGLETYTTAKSADFRQADDPSAQAHDAARHIVPQEPEAHAERLARRQADDESTARQDAERRIRSGESIGEHDAAHTPGIAQSLAAAAKEARAERDADPSQTIETHERAPHVTGRDGGSRGGGGRGR